MSVYEDIQKHNAQQEEERRLAKLEHMKALQLSMPKLSKPVETVAPLNIEEAKDKRIAGFKKF